MLHGFAGQGLQQRKDCFLELVSYNLQRVPTGGLQRGRVVLKEGRPQLNDSAPQGVRCLV